MTPSSKPWANTATSPNSWERCLARSVASSSLVTYAAERRQLLVCVGVRSLGGKFAIALDVALTHAELHQAYGEIRDLKDQIAQEKVYLESFG